MSKLRCILTGELRKATPEEYVRQRLIGMLLMHGYSREDMRANLAIKHGSQLKYVDLAIMRRVGQDKDQQRHVMLVAEVKRSGVAPGVLEAARQQVFSYASSCTNAFWCVVYDGSQLEVYRKGYVRDANGERGDWTFVSSKLPPPEQVALPLPHATLNREPAASRGPLALTRFQNAWGSWTDEDRATEVAAFKELASVPPPPLPETASAMGHALQAREERPWMVPVTQRLTERMPKPTQRMTEPMAPPKPRLTLAGALLVPLVGLFALAVLALTGVVAFFGLMLDKLRN